MGKFMKGDIVVINFPFSDLSGSKRRPALVLADLDGDDIILCQITSGSRTDKYSVKLDEKDFVNGKLSVKSVVRPNKTFTADKNVILYTACKISEEKTNQVINAVIEIVNGQTEKKNTAKGNIIFLNGVSSSGKTTLAKVLQERLAEPFYRLGADMFGGDILPEKFLTNDDAEYQFCLKAYSAMFHTIKTYSDMGLNTIVEHVLGEDNLKESVRVLHEYPVLFIHVTCPLEELRRREKERGDRRIGQGEDGLIWLAPQDSTYDITVDTHANTTEECADKIIKMLNYPDKWTAFKTLWEQRAK